MKLQSNVWLGLLGILGLWIAAGVSIPLISYLGSLTKYQLLLARGVMTLTCVALFSLKAYGRITKPSFWRSIFRTHAFWMAALFGIASVGLFNGLRLWGTKNTMVVWAAMPIANYLISRARKHPVASIAPLSLVLVLLGELIALWPKEGQAFVWGGLGWSILGMVANAGSIEVQTSAKNYSIMEITLWSGIGVTVVGLFGGLQADWRPLAVPSLLMLTLFFSLAFGFLDGVFGSLAVTNLPAVTVSVLAKGITPIAIVLSQWMNREQVLPAQWIGVASTIVGVSLLTRGTVRQRVKTDGS